VSAPYCVASRTPSDGWTMTKPWPSALNWHPGQMAKEIDPLRAKGALAVVKQHPGMVLFAASPGIVALGVVWWLFGSGWAALLFIALVLGGGAALLLKR
jgi:hypothetical protein